MKKWVILAEDFEMFIFAVYTCNTLYMVNVVPSKIEIISMVDNFMENFIKNFHFLFLNTSLIIFP